MEHGVMSNPAQGLKLFHDLPELSPASLRVIEGLGFTETTPVQAAVIPLFCGNKDVAVDAATGSGKTLAFVLPIVERLRRLEDPMRKHQIGAIIVAPTRELSKQIFNVAQPFLDTVPGLTRQLLVGGTDPAEDIRHFREHGGQVLVGTPGRIDDILKRCHLMDTRRLEVLVLDEADRLLDLGFRTQLDSIMSRLPKQRRTGLFSATQTEAVQALARAGLRNSVRINVAVSAASTAKQGSFPGRVDPSVEDVPSMGVTQRTPTQLQISYRVTELNDRLPELVRFLQAHATSEKIIVYFLTCACVDFHALALSRLGPKMLPGVQVKALHGRMKQSVRESTLEAYTKLPAGVLLATDLAARGLDIPEVHWVVQVDAPQDPSAFVHRVGRTARAGKSGAALLYLSPHETSYVDFLKLRNVPLMPSPQLQGPPLEVASLLRKESESDREFMETGTKAFVSYVRGYKEHHCRFIFRVQDLSLGRLACAFGLLRLPHMPEVKKALMAQPSGGSAGCLEHFSPSPVDIESIRFKDKAREKQRQKVLRDRAQQAAKVENNTKKRARTDKGAKPDALHQSGERLTAAVRRKLQAQDEAKDLAVEYALLRKVKSGRMSEHAYEVATGLAPADSEGSESERSSVKDNAGQSDSSSHSGKLLEVLPSTRGASGRKRQKQGGGVKRQNHEVGSQPSAAVKDNQLQLKQKARMHKLKRKKAKSYKKKATPS